MHSSLINKLLALLFFAVTANANLYITITSSNVKRARLAVAQIHLLPDASRPDLSLIRKVREQLFDDLEFTNLFEFIPDATFAPYDSAKSLHEANYQTFDSIGASFVLKLGYKVEDGKLILEGILLDVTGKKKIFGTRYQYASAQYPRLVHTLVEDILKELTGEQGLYLSRIAMVCWDKGVATPDKDIYVVNPDGSNPIKLTSDRTLSMSPAWSPDGKYLAYTQFDWQLSGHVRKKGMVLKRHDLSSGARQIISAREGMNSGAAFMPEGNKLVATLSFNGRPELYILDTRGVGQPEPLSRNIQWSKMGSGFQNGSNNLLFEVEASIAPDGKKMVFSSRRTGHPMIYTVDLESRVANQLTFAGQYNATPAWSPKGDKIIFAAQRTGEGNFDLYIIDPDGNNLARVTNGERAGRRVNSENPSWAPTGRHVAYASNDGGTYGIYVMSIDGSAKRKISPPGKECKSPAWGPAERD